MKKRLFLLVALFALTLSFTACNGAGGGGGLGGLGGLSFGAKKLDSVSYISYDGTLITWQGVPNAGQYAVSINGQSPISASGTMFSYSNAAGGTFTVSIVAKADKYKDSDAVTKTFTQLGTVSEITVSDEGVVSFAPVDGAAYYLVKVDDVEHRVNGTTFDQLTAGTHTVKVCAKADSIDGSIAYYSKYSSPKTITICGEIDKNKIQFNTLTNTISWQGVSNAKSYEVSIQTGVDIVTETVNKTSYTFDPFNANFTIGIRALGNHTTSFDSSVSVEKAFIYLETAKNIHLEDGILYWNEVIGANGYKLRLNGGSVVSVDKCEYSGLPVNSSVDVEIMPICTEDGYFTSWSVRETFKILPAPVLQWKGNHDAFDGSVVSSVIWDAVENAKGYMVALSYMAPTDKQPSIPQLTNLSDLMVGFEYDYLEVGTYFVKVKSLSSDSDPNTSDSKYSPEIKVIRLAAPSMIANGIVSSSDNLQDGVTVSFNGVSRATEYRVWKENNIYQTVSNAQFKDYNVVDSEVIVEQLIDYKIQSIGKNVATENGVTTVVLDSLTSNMLNLSVKVLATPNVKDMNGYIYSYDSVQGAYGYNVSVNGQNNGRDNTTIDLSYLESGTFNVKVCARGNGSDILASNYSKPLQIYRLMSPYDIKVLTDSVNEGVLSFSSDPNNAGSGFELHIDGSETAIPVDSLTNMKQYITTTGTEVFMRATANRYNELKTVYYMTSPASETLHIKKLMPVTFGNYAFTNTQFIWNVSSGAIRYEVYNAQDILYGSFDGASMQLDSLENGRDYVFKVKAIGDGITTFNSDFSDQKSIYKLKAPKLTLSGDRYTWNAVADATSYAFYIDGEIASLDIHVSGEEYYVIPNFNKLKTYSVQVKAVGDGGVRTIDSGFTTIEQQTRQLSTPDFTISYSNGYYIPDGEIIVNITLETPNANGYTYIVGGVSSFTKEKTFRYNPNGAGTYSVGVYAVGGIFDDNGVYCLSSQTCGNNSAYSIKLLGSVNESNIKLSMDGRITWTPVDSATSYTLKLVINGEEQEEITVYTTAYDLSDLIAFKNVTSLEVQIQAHGNSKCVSSTYTTKDWPVVVH